MRSISTKNLLIILVSVFSLGCAKAEYTNTSLAQPVTSSNSSPAPDAELEKQFADIAKDANGKVGVHAILIGTGRTASLNADERFAMQSVVKLPVAMAVLAGIESGEHTLEKPITFTNDELANPNQRSPIRDRNPNGGTAIVKELLRLSVSESDGTACDVLTRIVGGPAGLQRYIDELRITEMKAPWTHKEFGRDWAKQYENWATPRAAVALLEILHQGGGGIGQHRELLLRYMTDTPTGPNRLKGLLPSGTVVAHKTGSGGTRNGITSATNDVGLITLPDGRQIAIAVFVGDSRADEKTRERVIARIAKAVWDRWTA